MKLLDSLKMKLYIVSTELLYDDGTCSGVIQWSSPLVARSDEEAISRFDEPLFDARKKGDFAHQRVTLYSFGSFSALQHFSYAEKCENFDEHLSPIVIDGFIKIKSVDLTPETDISEEVKN